MSLLRVDQLCEGMEIEADVLNHDGQPILRAGVIITDRYLRRFRMWGVEEVQVVGCDDQALQAALPVVDPEVLRECELTARELFRHVDLEYPVMNQLYDACLVRLAQGAEGAHRGT